MGAVEIAPPPSGSGIPCSLRAYVPVSVPHVPVFQNPCLQPYPKSEIGMATGWCAPWVLTAAYWRHPAWVAVVGLFFRRHCPRCLYRPWKLCPRQEANEIPAEGVAGPRPPRRKCQSKDLNQVHHCRPTLCRLSPSGGLWLPLPL